MEQFAETAVESIGVKAASGGELRGGVEDAGGDHGDDEIAMAAGNRIEDGIELEIAQAPEDGRGVAVRKGAGDEERIGQGRAAGRERASQGQAESMDLMNGQMREIGEGAALDLAVFAVGSAEEDGGRGHAVGHRGHIHAYIISHEMLNNNKIIHVLHAYKL